MRYVCYKCDKYQPCELEIPIPKDALIDTKIRPIRCPFSPHAEFHSKWEEDNL